MMLFAAARYHHLSGQVGLISDNDALQRLFADTSIASVESWERLPDGSTRGFAFTPPGKFTLAETELYRFEGYIGDREKLGAARRRRTAGVPWTARVSRWARNAGLLVSPDFVWPEVERAKRGWRQRLHEWMQPMLRWILPLAFVGLVGAAIRPRPVVVIAVAHLVTSAFSAALYFGEARYRVPYDAFVFVLAVSGLVVLVRLASHVWRRRSPAGRLASA
jgi:hypothetical protein